MMDLTYLFLNLNNMAHIFIAVSQKMARQNDVNGKGAAMTSLKLICENKNEEACHCYYFVLWHELPRFMLPAE